MKVLQDENEIKKIFFYFLLTVTVLWTIHAYVVPILWAAITAIIAAPLYDKATLRFSKHKANFLIGALILLVVGLVLFFVIMASLQAKHYFDENSLSSTIASIKHQLFSFKLLRQQKEQIYSLFDQMSLSKMLPVIQYTANQISSFIICFLIYYAFVFYFLTQKKSISSFFVEKIFSFYQHPEKYIDMLVDMTRAIAANIFVTAGMTACVMTVVYLVFGLSFPVLVGLVTGLISIVPFVLPFFYVLLLIIMVLSKQYVAGFIIVAVGMLLNFVTDNILQPRLINKKANMGFSVSLLGILGGLDAFGFIGLFLGPLLVNFALRSFAVESRE